MKNLKVETIILLFFFNLLLYIQSFTFNATVSLDGSIDHFKTITDAIASVPNNLNTRFYIHVTPGTYHECLQIPPTKTFIALIGDNALTTIIVDDRSNARGFKTIDSATLSECHSISFFIMPFHKYILLY